MLGYRHFYHAGNFADVLKHAVLCFTLEYLRRKDKPVYVLDTHAGAAVYDLDNAQARKTAEHEGGIARLIAAPGPVPELVAGYLAEARRALDGGRPYPGSPALIAARLRLRDRFEAVERHPADYAALAAWAEGPAGTRAGGPRARALHDDGFAVLKARMPPPERRGLVLIDPSYEIKSDYDTVAEALTRACRRFGTGVFLLWYPVILRERTEAMLDRLCAIPRRYRIELCMTPDTEERGMTGAGLIVINPPYTLPEAAEAAMPWLAAALGATGPAQAEWAAA